VAGWTPKSTVGETQNHSKKKLKLKKSYHQLQAYGACGNNSLLFLNKEAKFA
jgi:hypothetical protein